MTPREPPGRTGIVNVISGGVLVGLGLLWTWSGGMDLNWDLLNYHYYGAHALLNERIAQDYLPSYQAYFNPTIFVPFYAMVQAGLPSLVIAFILALVHLVNVGVAWSLTRSMLGDAQRSPWLPWSGAALMFVAPLFLTVLGNSFADAITSIPILWALLLLSRDRPRWGTAVDAAVAGLLLGAAGGLKLTNAFLAVCAWLTFVLAGRGPLDARFRTAIVLGLGGLAGALLTHGFWSVELYRTFGNPVFPLFNNVFQSADFLPAPYIDHRYVTGLTLWEQLLLPVRMLEGQSWIYSENPAPDLRPLALLLVIAAGLLIRKRRTLHGVTALPFPLRWMTAYFGISFLAWILISSNGRYAIALLLLVGPLLAAWLATLLKDRWAIACVAGITGMQIVLQAQAGNPRWAAANWRTPWIDVVVPEDLKARPHTFLLTSNQSYSALAPALHPASSLIGLVGQYIQPAGEAMTSQLRRRLGRPVDELRVVLRAQIGEGHSFVGDAQAYRNRASPLIPYGLKLAPERCQMISLRRAYLRDVLLPGRVNTLPLDEDPGFEPLAVCKVMRAPPAEVASVMDMVSRANAIFARIERACGKSLDPHGSQTAYYFMKPYRNYLNSNRQLVHDVQSNLVHAVQLGVQGKIGLGPGTAWLSDNSPGCPSFPPTYDSGLMP